MELDALIARLEKATGPDRELDAHIAAAVVRPEELGKDYHGCTVAFVLWAAPDDPPPPYRAHAVMRVTNESGDSFEEPWDEIPAYTASLDAALTLVPVDADFVHLLKHKDAEGWAAVGRLVTSDRDDKGTVRAPTLPLALVIAALSARAALATPAPRTDSEGG